MPTRCIHSRSSLMPSFVMLPFIQCHHTRGLASSGGAWKPCSSAAPGMGAEGGALRGQGAGEGTNQTIDDVRPTSLRVCMGPLRVCLARRPGHDARGWARVSCGGPTVPTTFVRPPAVPQGKTTPPSRLRSSKRRQINDLLVVARAADRIDLSTSPRSFVSLCATGRREHPPAGSHRENDATAFLADLLRLGSAGRRTYLDMRTFPHRHVHGCGRVCWKHNLERKPAVASGPLSRHTATNRVEARLHPTDATDRLRTDAYSLETRRGWVDTETGEGVGTPLDDVPKHEVVLRRPSVRIPRLGETRGAVRELVAVPGFRRLVIHVEDHVGAAAVRQRTEEIPIADIAGGQRIATL